MKSIYPTGTISIIFPLNVIQSHIKAFPNLPIQAQILTKEKSMFVM